jgi:hypothetical protein
MTIASSTVKVVLPPLDDPPWAEDEYDEELLPPEE